jgi:hypothetical protein
MSRKRNRGVPRFRVQRSGLKYENLAPIEIFDCNAVWNKYSVFDVCSLLLTLEP